MCDKGDLFRVADVGGGKRDNVVDMPTMPPVIVPSHAGLELPFNVGDKFVRRTPHKLTSGDRMRIRAVQAELD